MLCQTSMVTALGNGYDDLSSNSVCITHNTHTLGKGMNPTILSPAMGKIVGETEFF